MKQALAAVIGVVLMIGAIAWLISPHERGRIRRLTSRAIVLAVTALVIYLTFKELVN